jgi:hypothetical protein
MMPRWGTISIGLAQEDQALLGTSFEFNHSNQSRDFLDPNGSRYTRCA